MNYLNQLEIIMQEIIEPQADIIDQKGQFPRDAITALGKVGLMGLLSAKEVGGMGLGLAEAALVVERIAKSCPSTAMVITMHYCGTSVIEKFGLEATRREIASGKHLTTLAWSESGSRSHFWTPVGTARQDGDFFIINSEKSMVTSAGEADSYVWSSKPYQTPGASTLWLVSRHENGLKRPKLFDGIGLRGNASAPMIGMDLRLSKNALLGADGGGFDSMIGIVLPLFSTLVASNSVGIMAAVIEHTTRHVTKNNFEHLKSSLAELPTIRAYLAKAHIRAEMARTLRDDTVAAIATGRPDAMLRVMQVKVAAAEAALEVSDIAMRICGGSAFRRDVGIERFFRDARAASIMAPTSDVLFDFIGKAVCDIPVFG